ncbi:DUF3316 domain-containing protein [Vibrio makurazakiensis]|uniref:DUF3316 domain-containing protein n=1 Tax=Vibrio makurazakiensis TaxID=2910250 RepID=UPI003D144959
MNKLSIILITIAFSFVTSDALASPLHVLVEKNTVLHTKATESKESAYEEAVSVLTELKQSSPAELKQQLGVFSINLVTKSISLKDGSYIIAQEYMNEEGELRYKGLVNVNYEYRQVERNN